MRTRWTLPWARSLIAGALLAAAPAAAQFTQYTPAGQFEERREDRQLLLQEALERARWRAGRFFLDPWISLRDLAWIDNIRATRGGSESDLTATLGLGLRLYRPLGSEMTLAAHALPEYVWWQELSDRRRLNGRYGAALFGNLGRLGVELEARRRDESSFFSREVEVRVSTRTELASAALELEAGKAVSLFARGSRSRYRSLDEEELDEFDFLDRDEELLSGGIRFALGSSLSVGVGTERSKVEFEVGGADRSNSGVSPLLELSFAGRRLELEAAAAARDLEPEPGSSFIPYSETTGRLRASLRIAGRSKLQAWAYRNLVYTVDLTWIYYEDESLGLGWLTSLGGGASLRLFAETGGNDYRGPAGSPDRLEDLEAWGADLRVDLGRFTLVLGGNRTTYDSTLPGFDREITVVRAGVVLGDGGASPWY